MEEINNNVIPEVKESARQKLKQWRMGLTNPKRAAIIATLTISTIGDATVLTGCQDDDQTPSSQDTKGSTEQQIIGKTPSADVATVEDIDTGETKGGNNQDNINALLIALSNDTTKAETGTINLETVQQQNKKAFDALFISTTTGYHSKDTKRIEELAKSINLGSDEAFDDAIVYIVTNLQGKEVNFGGWISSLSPEQKNQLTEKGRTQQGDTFIWGGSKVASL